MQTVLRWVVKIVLGLLAFLAWETAYFGIPEAVSKQVALVQALGGEGFLRYVLLPLLGLVLALLAIGPARVKKSVKEVADLARGHPGSEGERELETQERWREEDVLDAYFNQMEQWLHDQNRPLRRATRDDEVRASAQERTLTVLERLRPDGKRKVLRFLHGHPLIEHDENIISLRDANLSEANLSDISLPEARLDYAILHNADLSCAKLCDRFRGGSAEISGSAQKGGDWTDLARPMRTASFFNAKLNGAVLEGAKLVCCYMIGADFVGANLDKADLRGAELRWTRNLTQEQIEQAYGSCGWGQEGMPDTELPNHLKAPEAWRKLLSQQRRERGDL